MGVLPEMDDGPSLISTAGRRQAIGRGAWAAWQRRTFETAVADHREMTGSDATITASTPDGRSQDREHTKTMTRSFDRPLF